MMPLYILTGFSPARHAMAARNRANDRYPILCVGLYANAIVLPDN